MRHPIEPLHAIAPSVAPRPAEVPRELELIDYLAAILAHRWLVLGLAFGLALLTAVGTLMMTRVYQAAALISVRPPKIEGQPPAEAAPQALVPVVRSDALVSRLLSDLKLDQPPFSLNATKFLRSALAVSTVAETSFIEIKVTLPDPEMARRAADELATRTVARARQIDVEEGGGVEEQIRAIAAESEQRFRTAETALREFRTKSQVELLRKDVEAKLGQRGDFLKLLIEIDGERGRLAMAEQEVKSRPEVDVVTDSITRNSQLLMEAARQNVETPASLIGLSVESQRINTARKEIDVELATTRTKLAALERQRDEMIRLGQVNADALPVLTELYAREAALARLQLEYDVARKAYEDASTNYLNAKVRTAVRTPFVQVVERPTRPTTPQSRYLVRNAAIAAVAGATIACLIAFARLAMSRIATLPRPGEARAQDA